MVLAALIIMLVSISAALIFTWKLAVKWQSNRDHRKQQKYINDALEASRQFVIMRDKYKRTQQPRDNNGRFARAK